MYARAGMSACVSLCVRTDAGLSGVADAARRHAAGVTRRRVITLTTLITLITLITQQVPRNARAPAQIGVDDVCMCLWIYKVVHGCIIEARM